MKVRGALIAATLGTMPAIAHASTWYVANRGAGTCEHESNQPIPANTPMAFFSALQRMNIPSSMVVVRRDGEGKALAVVVRGIMPSGAERDMLFFRNRDGLEMCNRLMRHFVEAGPPR